MAQNLGARQEMGQVVFDGKAQEVLDDADMRQQYLAI